MASEIKQNFHKIIQKREPEHIWQKYRQTNDFFCYSPFMNEQIVSGAANEFASFPTVYLRNIKHFRCFYIEL